MEVGVGWGVVGLLVFLSSFLFFGGGEGRVAVETVLSGF